MEFIDYKYKTTLKSPLLVDLHFPFKYNKSLSSRRHDVDCIDFFSTHLLGHRHSHNSYFNHFQLTCVYTSIRGQHNQSAQHDRQPRCPVIPHVLTTTDKVETLVLTALEVTAVFILGHSICSTYIFFMQHRL